nr:MAG TPA: hypothetical protein [Caudoviricetes sp.]
MAGLFFLASLNAVPTLLKNVATYLLAKNVLYFFY